MPFFPLIKKGRRKSGKKRPSNREQRIKIWDKPKKPKLYGKRKSRAPKPTFHG